MGCGCSSTADNTRVSREGVRGVALEEEMPQTHRYFKLHAHRTYNAVILRETPDDDFETCVLGFAGQLESDAAAMFRYGT